MEDKIEVRKRINKLCNWCFILDIVLIILYFFLSTLRNVPAFIYIIYYILILILFFVPLLFAIKEKVPTYNLFLNILGTIFVIQFLMLFSLSMSEGNKEAAQGARIKADMDQFRSNAEVYKIHGDSYGGLININILNGEKSCIDIPNSIMSKETEGKALCEDIQNQAEGELRVYSNSTAYCIQKVLPGEAKTKWCLDSKGNVGSTVAECNLVNFSCDKQYK